MPQFSGSWDLDVWGKVRRQIESNTSAAQASAADLDNAKLSAQGALATAYFNLRAADALRELLDRTVKEYKTTLEIVQNQFNSGYAVSKADVATAEAQVFATEAQALNVGVQRAQFEHAIAMLIGRPPAELTIAMYPLAGHSENPGLCPFDAARAPPGHRRGRADDAGAERADRSRHSRLFPGHFTVRPAAMGRPQPVAVSCRQRGVVLGAAGTQVLFNGGLTSAQVDAARAVYWQSVANYRQTVLSAFQQVEDELAAVRILRQELVVQQRAVKDARTAVDVYLNQFKAGTVAFTTVVTAEITLLADEEAELTIRQNLFLASVGLIQALGGGWDANLLPTQKELVRNFSLLPQL